MHVYANCWCCELVGSTKRDVALLTAAERMQVLYEREVPLRARWNKVAPEWCSLLERGDFVSDGSYDILRWILEDAQLRTTLRDWVRKIP